VVIDVLLFFYFAVVFNFNVFPFPASKAQLLGNVLMNRQNAANCYPLFELFSFLCSEGR